MLNLTGLFVPKLNLRHLSIVTVRRPISNTESPLLMISSQSLPIVLGEKGEMVTNTFMLPANIQSTLKSLRPVEGSTST